ncbi:DUF362 domain-containing protein [Desulfuromonas sp. AOP6]|uniref:DUF362 domain-containing protein n=1 Tax=Desulfuromonas sp. AOP6 TaxID=1566351 RepID=UPI001288FB4C|nr:DUF362 domain-containing protein [Desulfuromonas sp. AOP6]BCA79973.1 hypothetical protein AOP6_1760 [Desulfuromonas sp. AOP6]
MDRRAFIRQTLQAALAVTAVGSVPILSLLPRPILAAAGSTVAVRKGENIPLLVRQTLDALGGMTQFVKKGETVVVKPNIGWDRTPELAANTNPLVVRTVVELCLEAGAKQVQVFDRPCNDPRRCYVQSGIQEAVESIGSNRVKVEHMDRRGWQELDIAQGVELQRWEFYRPALEADRFINLPIAKHHGLSTVTLGMKNIMGVIGGNRGRLHRQIDEALCDINLIVPSDLTLIDATRVLVANGPQGGRAEDVRRLDTLVASADIVAADSIAATLLGHQPDDISTLVTAGRRGLGIADLARIRRV